MKNVPTFRLAAIVDGIITFLYVSSNFYSTFLSYRKLEVVLYMLLFFFFLRQFCQYPLSPMYVSPPSVSVALVDIEEDDVGEIMDMNNLITVIEDFPSPSKPMVAGESTESIAINF